jgi:hypothetical protein
LFRACLCRCRSNGKDFEELNRGQLSLRLIVLLVLGRPGTLARVVPDSAINRRICLASYGPKWPGKHSPGVTLDNSPHPISPEGVTRWARIGSEPGNRIARSSCPFRAERLFRLIQSKPWAKLSCPSGAGFSGRMTDAKHIQTLGKLRRPAIGY